VNVPVTQYRDRPLDEVRADAARLCRSRGVSMRPAPPPAFTAPAPAAASPLRARCRQCPRRAGRPPVPTCPSSLSGPAGIRRGPPCRPRRRRNRPSSSRSCRRAAPSGPARSGPDAAHRAAGPHACGRSPGPLAQADPGDAADGSAEWPAARSGQSYRPSSGGRWPVPGEPACRPAPAAASRRCLRFSPGPSRQRTRRANGVGMPVMPSPGPATGRPRSFWSRQGIPRSTSSPSRQHSGSRPWCDNRVAAGGSRLSAGGVCCRPVRWRLSHRRLRPGRSNDGLRPACYTPSAPP